MSRLGREGLRYEGVGGAAAAAAAAWIWGIGLRQFESIVAKSGLANERPSRGLGSQESIRKRRAGLAGKTGRAGEPGSQVPWGC